MKKKITLEQVYNLFQQYGDLGLTVNTPYGFNKILWCDITAFDSSIIRIELNNGDFIEGSPNHRVKCKNGQWCFLKNLIPGQFIQTIYGSKEIKTVINLAETEDLYDIEVDKVHQYYSNGIVSHNSTATVDLLLFLFFNETTKSNKASEIFNIYLPDENEVKVKGLVEISGVDYIIERSITRKGKNNATNTQLRIAKIVNGVEENLSEEQRRESEKIIVDSVGSKNDFLLTIISTGNNLEDLIDQKPTERGNLVTRFIGLDIIKEKEWICKEIKSEWETNIKSNIYNIVDLQKEIDDNEILITETDMIQKESVIKQNVLIDEIKQLDIEKEEVLGQKKPIDDTLLGVDINEEKTKLQTIAENGKTKKEEYLKLKAEFETKTKPEYDEQGHNKALVEEKTLVEDKHKQQIIKNDKEKEIVVIERENEKNIQTKETEIVNIERANEKIIQEKEKMVLTIKMEHSAAIKTKEKEVKDLEQVNKDLKEGEICPTCKRKLDNCDHSETIKENEKTIAKINKDIEKLNSTEDPRIKPIQDEIDKLKNTEDPQISVIRLEIKKLQEIEDPRVVAIQNEIKNINEVTIPAIDLNIERNKQKIEMYKTQLEALNQYDKDEIKVERLSVEVRGLAQDYKDQDDLIKRYNENLKAVEANKEVEKRVIDINFKIQTKNGEKDIIIRQQQINEDKIKNANKTIDDNKKLITIINKEQEVLKIFEYYLTIFGKKGITSLILKSSIPVINSELDRLLNDTATFSMELDLNYKNDVEYWMIDRETGLKKLASSGSGYERTAAALALRAVLTKISVLPKPDIIILDEVLGKVADENLELMKYLLDKVAEMFDKVFMITHNPLVKDWGDNVVTIEKKNNISGIKVNKNLTKAQV